MHSTYSRYVPLVIAVALMPALALAQQSAVPSVRGVVHGPDGTPIEGANVFLLETLDGAITGSDGTFSIAERDSAALTLIVRRVGFLPSRLSISPSERDNAVIVLTLAPHPLTPLAVQAGRYSASDARDATLTSLDVVTTPRAAADVNRAIQTLPGVQQVDEGTGLYVRGGDYTETKVFLNDAVVLNRPELESPNGTFTGTVDPFLLDGIVFSSGGFGARYGNSVSGIVSLHTQREPARQAITVSAGLAALSASVAQPLSHGIGARAAANVFDLAPLIRLNGSTHRYDPAPRGRDLSGSAIWRSDAAGEFSLFAIDQTSRLGVGVADPSYVGTYAADDRSGLVVANWHAAYGHFIPTVSVSTAHIKRVEEFGAFDLGTRIRQQQIFTQLEWAAADRITLRGGAELVRPAHRLLHVDTPAYVRSAHIRGHAATRPYDALTLTAAWGVYHEVPDPLLLDPTLGDGTLASTLAPMRAIHSIMGVQREGAMTARVELYDKRYTDLAQQNRDYVPVPSGHGFARGTDLFLKGPGPFGTSARLTYSHLTSRRSNSCSTHPSTTCSVAPTCTAIRTHWIMRGAYR